MKKIDPDGPRGTRFFQLCTARLEQAGPSLQFFIADCQQEQDGDKTGLSVKTDEMFDKRCPDKTLFWVTLEQAETCLNSIP